MHAASPPATPAPAAAALRTALPALLQRAGRHRVALTLGFFLVFPWLVPYHSLAINILIYGLYAVGFNLLFGYAGLLSFGHAAFLGVGAYTAGILIAQHGAAWWWAIPAAVAMACAVALAMGLLSRLLASAFGGVLEALRENEARTRACGFDVARTKLLAFVLSAGFCGLAGALNAIHLSSVPIETLHYGTSGLVVMLCLLGGMGTYFGPFVGAALFLLIQDQASAVTEHWQLYVGAVFVGFVLFFPKGVWGTLLERIGHGR